jgi:hypothetical protein
VRRTGHATPCRTVFRPTGLQTVGSRCTRPAAPALPTVDAFTYRERRCAAATARRRPARLQEGDRHLRRTRGARTVWREDGGWPAGRSVDAPTRRHSGSFPVRFSIDSIAPRRDGVRTSVDLPRWDVDDESDLTTSIQPITVRWFCRGTWLPDPARSNDSRSATWRRLPSPRRPTATARVHSPQQFLGTSPRSRTSPSISHIPATRDHGTAEKTQTLGHIPTAQPARPRDGADGSGSSPGHAASGSSARP